MPHSRLPEMIFYGDLTADERKVLRARYRKILRKIRKQEVLSQTEVALQALLSIFLTVHTVSLGNVERLVDAEFDDAEEDQGGPDFLEGQEAEETYEAMIAERLRERAEQRVKYESAYRILMRPQRRDL